MTRLLMIAFLGALQGVTEFLPISSDGHLAVAEALFHSLAGAPLSNDSLALNIIMHTGTLGSILVVYRTRIWRLLGSDRRVIPLLIVGTIPAVLIGVPTKMFASEWMTNPLLAGICLPITGIVLLWGIRRPLGEIHYQDITYPQAFLIGLFQAVAILPGISRSGTTIAAGLYLGLRRESAATFSFLLAIPAIAGATVLALKDLLNVPSDTSAPRDPAGDLIIAAVVSFVVGIVALRWLLAWLNQGKLHYFAYWCLGFGAIVTLWQLRLLMP